MAPKGAKTEDPGAQFRPAQLFVDESGTSRQDRFMVIGALKFRSGQGPLFTEIEQLRSRLEWNSEAHFVRVTRGNLYIYRELVELLADSDARFRAIFVDRDKFDPFKVKRDAWKTHAVLIGEALARSLTPSEMGAVVVDHISVPSRANYEGYIRTTTNNRLGRTGVMTVCRMDSRACWGIQLADVLTGAVAHQLRQGVGAAKAGSHKGKLADHIASKFNLNDLVSSSSPRFAVAAKTRSSSGSSRRLQVVKSSTA